MTSTPGQESVNTLTGDRETPFEHLAIRDVDHVQEYVDTRLSLGSRPAADELDESFPQALVRALSRDGHNHQHTDPQTRTVSVNSCDLEKEKGLKSDTYEEILYVDWEEGDPRNPINYSRTRKWAITCVASGLTGLVAAIASTYAMGYDSMIRDLNCTELQATAGLSLYALGFAIFPLILAPLSEEFGRQPLYVYSTFILVLMHLGVALAKNIQSVIIFRFIAGAAGSTGSTMVGGTIADIWAPHERGVPMAVFSIAAMSATGAGPLFAGWIAMSPHLEWRWIQWIHMIVAGILFLFVLFVMKETRSSVLLTRLAKKLRKETNDKRYRARIEDERGSLRSLILISCTRPCHLLLTEPVVSSFSLWVGFAWGILYVLIESIAPAFREIHGFNTGEVGTVFVTFCIGSLFGYLTNLFFSEKLYAKNVKEKGPEARLYAVCVAGIVFPLSMFMYAWTCFERVHWIAMCIAITLFMWSLFLIYLAVFTYLADCYGPFASSALAGQSLCRNMAGCVFPLFTNQMYDRLGFRWANTVFACIAVLMMPIPFILFHWGPNIRAKSKFAKAVPAFGS
ncbi:MFS general substrate transporter [Pyrrhoderma noxium]|uniref:MFS general substrate transporter n=1 Tax=Pyrrhoderma noxium TaxID=2282107 RepID=A0A286UKF3_9AGAM|nr:MFS general substrate transporter [Pyrrhoderma noxium]